MQRLPLPILLGALVSAQTTTAALGALTERARSQIPALGTTVPYALGNVLLTMWGSVIVLLEAVAAGGAGSGAAHSEMRTSSRIDNEGCAPHEPDRDRSR